MLVSERLLRVFSVRRLFAALAIVVFAGVGFGVWLQEFARLSPCPLCIFQRLLYLLIGCVALCGIVFPRVQRFWGGAMALVAAGGVGVSAYQSWMQMFPKLVNECGYGDPNLIEQLVDWLGMRWPSLFMATGFCTDRDWEFLRLSLANWSVLFFALFMVAGLAFLRRRQSEWA